MGNFIFPKKKTFNFFLECIFTSSWLAKLDNNLSILNLSRPDMYTDRGKGALT
jgi:hypothetical protein